MNQFQPLITAIEKDDYDTALLLIDSTIRWVIQSVVGGEGLACSYMCSDLVHPARLLDQKQEVPWVELRGKLEME